ncbi:Uncharacterised protein [Mycobacterium tuberculosis]|nr:Uncharacterised protein [Mycobacterium tuberculosis]
MRHGPVRSNAGAIRSAYVRLPGPALNGTDMAELGRLIQRLEDRLAAGR